MEEVQPGTKEYKKEFSEMIMISADYFTRLFGPKIPLILENLYIKENNLFSYEHCYVIKSSNEIASMVLCYDYDTKRRENLNTGWLLFKFLKFSLVVKNLSLLKQMHKTVGALRTGDFYISNIATFSKFKRQGIARKLLMECETIARGKNMRRMKLDVEKNNIPAITLYHSLGYTALEEFNINGKKINISFLRMTKNIL